MSKTSPETRTRPNILITGVPCTGKTTFAQRLIADSSATNLTYIDVNDAIVKHKLHSGFDDEYKSFVLDEDKFLDYLEEFFDGEHSDGGLIIDYHSCEFFPIRWFDHVIVLRCENAPLYDRLHERANYSEKKRAENLECEIMGVVAEEAHDSYPKEGVVHELQNNNQEDLERNVGYVIELIKKFRNEKSTA
ncbi:Adenylate kinase isoenzyme 6-like protein [Aphelenchoides besseyi]|nr:Adenylate kinase isoenzyme 6-like protein [Aphelenchoides besseyi]KAI6220303.1 Adenylate kinase isoenzyme 6-like protein [Aphelenchoides besseyi]